MPPGFRSDENKIRFLQEPVISCEWALAPIRNIISHHYKFHSFVTALHVSLELSNELKEACPHSFADCITELKDEAPEIFSHRYGRHLVMFASVYQDTPNDTDPHRHPV